MVFSLSTAARLNANKTASEQHAAEIGATQTGMEVRLIMLPERFPNSVVNFIAVGSHRYKV